MARSSIKPALALCAALGAFAFVAAPYSCAWGLNAYAAAGVTTVLLLGAMPFTPWFKAAAGRAVMLCLAYIGLATGVWITGLFVANVRIMCRLF